MLTRPRMLRAALGAAVALGVGAPSAHAACPTQTFSTPFAAWGDLALYAPVANADFASGLAGWTTTGSARLVTDTPGAIAPASASTQSLELPSGSSATTPPICVTTGSRSARMFAVTPKRVPTSSSTLQVEILYRPTIRGGQAAKKLGTLPDQPVWNAERKMSAVPGQFDVMPDSTASTYIQYRFTPLYGTTWRIDDLFVDPRFRG
jgi:hypothetical protein